MPEVARFGGGCGLWFRYECGRGPLITKAACWIVLDVVPTQLDGEGPAGEGLGKISQSSAAQHFAHFTGGREC